MSARTELASGLTELAGELPQFGEQSANGLGVEAVTHRLPVVAPTDLYLRVVHSPRDGDDVDRREVLGSSVGLGQGLFDRIDSGFRDSHARAQGHDLDESRVGQVAHNAVHTGLWYSEMLSDCVGRRDPHAAGPKLENVLRAKSRRNSHRRR